MPGDSGVGSPDPPGIFGTSPETKKVIDHWTNEKFLRLFREVLANCRSAIEAVQVVEGLRGQRRAARSAAPPSSRAGARCHGGATG
jgi:hypothetical protein